MWVIAVVLSGLLAGCALSTEGLGDADGGTPAADGGRPTADTGTVDAEGPGPGDDAGAPPVDDGGPPRDDAGPGVDDAGAGMPMTVTFGENSSDTHRGVTTDTFLMISEPDWNLGRAEWVSASGFPVQDELGMFRFDLAAIPAGAVVTGARLILWTNDDASSDVFEIFRVLESWTEGDRRRSPGISNWNQRTASARWTGPGCTAPGSRGTTSFGSFTPRGSDTRHVVDLAPTLVQGWVDGTLPNHGLIPARTGGSTGTSGAQFHSRESADDGRRPSLEVTYVP